MFADLRTRGKVPAIVDGAVVEAIKEGRIEVVAAVAALDSTAVELADGARIEPEAVICATGYRRALEPLVGHLGVLGERGMPKVIAPRRRRPGLRFAGYLLRPGGLGYMGKQARRSAQGDRPRASRLPIRDAHPARQSVASGDRPAPGLVIAMRLAENLIDASPTTLEQLEEIVTDVGRSPWLWGHAVSFDIEQPQPPRPLQDRRARDRAVRLGDGPGDALPRPRRRERSGIRLQRHADRGGRRGCGRAGAPPAHPPETRRVGVQLRARLHPPRPA